MTELHQLAASGVPEWIGLALTLLGIAAGIARRQQQSARRQGVRLGDLERLVENERTRRRQVDAVLIDLGIRLPYWPPDGPQQPRASRYEPYSGDGPWPQDGVPLPHDVDQVDDEDQDRYPGTYAVPAVPPFSPDEASRLARHRR